MLSVGKYVNVLCRVDDGPCVGWTLCGVDRVWGGPCVGWTLCEPCPSVFGHIMRTG